MCNCIKKLSVLLLLLSMLAGVSGCRESMAFAQTLYNQDFEEKTDDDELIENEPENEEEEDIFSVDEQDDADQENHFENTEAEYDSDKDGDAKAADASYLEYADNHGNSTQTNGGDSTERSDENADSSEGNEGESSGENETDGGGEGGNEDDLVSDGDEGGAGSEGGDLLVVDTSMEHLHTSEYVFATGNAALLVQMLGGEGKLAGCDSNTLANMRGYFPASELEGISTVWAAGGNSDLVPKTVNQMETLPDYCLYDMNDVNSAAINTLSALGVTCVGLDFHYASGILDAVETVREILGTEYADTMAQKYTAFYNGITGTLAGKIGTYTSGGVNYDCKAYGNTTTTASTCTNGVSTLFISAWDDNASYTVYRDDMDWSKTFPGLAVSNVSYTNSPISYYMSIAGVENKGAANATNTGGKATYVYTFGFASVKLDIKQGTLASAYETGLTSNQLASGLGGVTGASSGFGGAAASAGSAFPALVVASNQIKSSISSSEMWKVYDYDNQGGNTRGFYDGNGTIVQSIISDTYDIYVNPNGLGNWMTGSAESILEAPWIASKFHPGEAYSESDVRALISEFYSTFYRCTLSGTQIDAILAGD